MLVTRRSLILTALVLTLAGCGGGRHLVFPWPSWLAWSSCHSLHSTYAATIDATQNATLTHGFLRVPVVIHLMSDPADRVDRRPEQFWTAAFIGTYLGVGNLSVNKVWEQARIHFDLVRVERCKYKPPTGSFRVLASGAKAMFPPDTFTLRAWLPTAQQTIIDHYLQLNANYGVNRALNIFLWRNISGLTNGYGESPRRNRPEVAERGLVALSTVWYESWFTCGSLPGGDDCQLGIAHEMGHALGLAHSCYLCGAQLQGGTCCTDLCWAPRDYYFTCPANDTTSTRWNNFCACEGTPATTAVQDLTACGDTFQCCDPSFSGHRLMFPTAGQDPASGFELCQGEITSARSGAREFF